MTNKKKILVIGSKNHPLASKSVNWKEKIPYVGDFDIVIFNLQSLDADIFKEILPKLETIKKDLTHAIGNNTEVICITQKTFFDNSIQPHTNYHWCPFIPIFEEKEGEEFNNDDPKSGYFKFVDKWSNIYVNCYSEDYKTQKRSHFELEKKSLLRNKANKILGIKIYIREFEGESSYIYDQTYSNPITFLPPPTNSSCEVAINFLIDLYNYSEFSLPQWAIDINLANEKEINDDINKNQQEITRLKSEIEDASKEIDELNKFKQLLTEGGEGATGDRLEDIVEEALEVLGIKVKKGKKGEEDRNILDPISGEEIPIEIGGMEKSIPEKKLAQLLKWITSKEDPKIIKTRGLLIGNAYSKIPLDKDLNGRPPAVESNVIKRAIACDISILPTIELFKAIKAKKSGEVVSDFIQQLFNEIGLINFKKELTSETVLN